MITLLMKENTVIKKCLHEMMKNQEKLNDFNNEVYFEEVSEDETFSENSLIKKENGSRFHDEKNVLQELKMSK